MVKIGMVIASGLIIIGFLGMAMYKFDLSSTVRNKVVVDKKWEFDARELEHLDVYGGSTNMKVEFIKSGSDQSAYVQVKGTTNKDVAQKIESTEIFGKTLSLDMSTKEWGFFSFDFTDRTIHLTVALPEQEMLDTVHFSLHSGNGSYSNLKGKTIHIGASSGNIKFSDLEAQNISLECSSGNIKGSGITGNIQITSKSGNVTIDELAGDSIVKLSSGNVNIKQKTIANADINVRSGNATFTVSKDFAGFYDLRASSGNIKSPDSKRITQDIIKIRSSSGNITVKEY